MDMRADYVVIGAGTSGLAFTDALVAGDPEAEVVVVDRNDDPGGHWVHAYPFVRLHSPSWFYGVESRHLGEDRLDSDGLNKGLYERASKAELLGYFSAVVDALEATGRVRFLFAHEYADGAAHGTRTGLVVPVQARRRVVDARYLEASVPATHTPSFEVADAARFLPVGRLPDEAADGGQLLVLGSGKTAVDACLWLLEHDTDPDRIRWVRPRDAWWHDRARYQGLDLVGDTIAGLANDAVAIASATDVRELQERLEDSGNLLRLDPTVDTTMYRGGMLSVAEADRLRILGDVVRLGHVRRVERDRLLLEKGPVETGRDTVVVDCTARGLNDAAPRPVWSPERITLQQVRHNSPPFNAALIGWVEAHRSDDTEKNRLCPPNAYATGISDYARMFTRTWATEGGWLAEPDLTAWVGGTRLNVLRDLARRQGDDEVRAATGRFLGSVLPALENAGRLV